MQEIYGQSCGVLIALHGGAGSWDAKGSQALQHATAALRRIAKAGLAALGTGKDPLDVTVDCLQAMELDTQFNAGRGAALQADAQARLTAALMNGERQCFSGVISASYVVHPSLVARHLQDQSARVLTNPGAELVARQLGLPVESAYTPERMHRWLEQAMTTGTFCDTVGAIVRTADGKLYAGTSTGGRGYEFPGRVSDSATVAGTYCTRFLGVSATGVGEEIVDDAVAARMETRRRDGMSLQQASRRCFEEALEKKRAYGWVALDGDGAWAAVHTTPAMSYVVISSDAGELAASHG